MDIMSIVVNLVGGIVGGNATGMAWKEKSLGAVGNSIAGAVGGVAGSYIAQAMGIITSMGLENMTIGSIATEGGIAAIGGAITTAIVGFIKSKMANK